MTNDKVEILVCMNVGCRSRGSRAILSRLEEKLKERGKDDVVLERIICFAACNVGPNVVIPTKRCWLSGVTAEDAEDVVRYLDGKSDIARLQSQNDADLEKMIFAMIDAGLLEREPTA
jgi:NADH:ubiquinone oxidoreductase subunit E